MQVELKFMQSKKFYPSICILANINAAVLKVLIQPRLIYNLILIFLFICAIQEPLDCQPALWIHLCDASSTLEPAPLPHCCQLSYTSRYRDRVPDRVRDTAYLAFIIIWLGCVHCRNLDSSSFPVFAQSAASLFYQEYVLPLNYDSLTIFYSKLSNM